MHILIPLVIAVGAHFTKAIAAVQISYLFIPIGALVVWSLLGTSDPTGGVAFTFMGAYLALWVLLSIAIFAAIGLARRYWDV